MDERERIILLCEEAASMSAGNIAVLMEVRIDEVYASLDLWRECARYIMKQIRGTEGTNNDSPNPSR